LINSRGKKIEPWGDASASLLFSLHPGEPIPQKPMIEPSTIQTLLEVGLLAFLGTLAMLLRD